jgi:hypothetical protein
MDANSVATPSSKLGEKQAASTHTPARPCPADTLNLDTEGYCRRDKIRTFHKPAPRLRPASKAVKPEHLSGDRLACLLQSASGHVRAKNGHSPWRERIHGTTLDLNYISALQPRCD